MTATAESEKRAVAIELMATLSGRRIGYCGFGTADGERISRILREVDALPVPFEERQLGEPARVCDAILVKLASLSAEGLRAAAVSPAPTLVMADSTALLEGNCVCYAWPCDFMSEPWDESEMLVRLFRLVQSPGNGRTSGGEPQRMDPLVLLADDDPEMLALIEAVLRNDGIACRTASNGLTALQLARSLAPDILVLDVRMPKMNGFEVLDTVRRDPALERLPVILLTGCDDPADVAKGSELRADEYLRKPVSPIVLLTRVKRRLSVQSDGVRPWARSLPGNTPRRWTAVNSRSPMDRP